MIKTEDALLLTIDRFWESIPPVWNQIRGHLRSIAQEKFEISVEQFHVLRHIRRGIRSVSDLATVKRISRSAISQSVDGLVEKGLISRRPHTDDRRFVELELTPNGDDMLNAIFDENRAWMIEKMSALTPEELAQMQQAFRLLKDAFQE